MLNKRFKNWILIACVIATALPISTLSAQENDFSTDVPKIKLLTDFDQYALSVEISSYKDSSINIYLNCKLLKTITMEDNTQKELIVDNWIPGNRYSIMTDITYEDGTLSDCSNVIHFIAPNDEIKEEENKEEEEDTETASNQTSENNEHEPEAPKIFSNPRSQKMKMEFPDYYPQPTNKDSTNHTKNSNKNPKIYSKNEIANFKILDSRILGIETTNNNQSNIANTKCNIKVHKDLRTIEQQNCKIPKPIISKADAIKDNSLVKVTAKGQISPDPSFTIEYFRCKAKTLWDPRTWFKCIDQKYMERTLTPNFINKIYSDTQGFTNYYDYYHADLSNFEFSLKKTYLNHTPLKISVRNAKYGSIYLLNQWIEINLISEYQSAEIHYSNQNFNENALNLPIIPPVGVTQWYGYTDFQSPHTGIDFGIKDTPIYSPAEGIITHAQWDNYSGECLSGGHFIKIKHHNGYYTVYLHLKNYINQYGHTWKPGDQIHQGDLIGISGNTGAYNCQPLGYHLHYETRTESSYTSHTDPVPITNTDWNQIPTLGWQTYPGRLSGNNPHPNY